MRRATVYTIALVCYTVILAILGASLWMRDEWPAWAGLILFTVLCMLSAVLITLNEH